MKKISMTLCALSLIMFSGSAIQAQTNFWFESDGKPVFYLTLPDSWEGEWQEEDGLDVLHATSEEETAYLSLWALHDVEDLQEAAVVVEEMLGEWVNEFEAGKWEEGTNNTIPATYTEGTAVDNDTGEALDLFIALFIPRKGQVFILIVVGEQAYRDEHSDEIQSILQSIRRKE